MHHTWHIWTQRECAHVCGHLRLQTTLIKQVVCLLVYLVRWRSHLLNHFYATRRWTWSCAASGVWDAGQPPSWSQNFPGFGCSESYQVAQACLIQHAFVSHRDEVPKSLSYFTSFDGNNPDWQTGQETKVQTSCWVKCQANNGNIWTLNAIWSMIVAPV